MRGKPAEILAETTDSGEQKLIVVSEDTLLGRRMRIPVDMVVLCTAMEARKNAPEVARIFGVNQGGDGFFLEEHPKLGPVSTATDGIFLAGTCQSPKDIPDTVSHASGAAAQALALATRGKVEVSPVTSWIDPDICAGCQTCIKLCAYSAIEFNERRGVSEVNEAVCKGCGSCAGFLPERGGTGEAFYTQADICRNRGNSRRGRLASLTRTWQIREENKWSKSRTDDHRFRLQLVHIHRGRSRRDIEAHSAPECADDPDDVHGHGGSQVRHQGPSGRR